MFTPDVQIALLVAVPLTLTALGGIIVPFMTDRRANRKLDHITVLTNSTLTTANERIASLERLVEKLLIEKGMVLKPKPKETR